MLFESLATYEFFNSFVQSVLVDIFYKLSKDTFDDTLSGRKLDRVFSRALKRCIKDYKPEKIKAAKEAFLDKRIENEILAFREKKKFVKFDLFAEILSKALGETSGKQTSACIFETLRMFIAKDQKLSHEIELLYAELSMDYLQQLVKEHKDRREEHQHIVKSIQEIQKLLKDIGHPPVLNEKIKVLNKAYLKRLMEQINHSSLAWIDVQSVDSAQSEIELPALYTALMTEQTEAMLLDTKKREINHRVQVSALNQLNRDDRLVLLGDPGSGKSTFVDFICLCLAGEGLCHKIINIDLLTQPVPKNDEDEEPETQEWDHGFLLPIRIVLRELATALPQDARVPGTCKQVFDHILKQLGSHNEPHKELLLYHYFTTGTALIFFDGLDEVPDAENKREQVKAAVAAFVSEFPLCRYCVTSRIYAYQKQQWQLPDFNSTTLASFSLPLIFSFVEKWYAELGHRRGDFSEEIQGNSMDLKDRIQRLPRLQALAERPLLLTLMATIHDRKRTLPEKREQLYAEVVDVLLNRWEKRKIQHIEGKPRVIQPSLSEFLNTGADTIRQAVNGLAFDIHQKQVRSKKAANIPQDQLVNSLLNVGHPDIKPKRLIEYLQDRAGLLESRGQGVYCFPHRQFQEYLAACHLTENESPDVMAYLLFQDPDKWREVILLAGAKAARGMFDNLWNLADALCYEDFTDRVSEKRMIGAYIAGKLLIENDALERRISERNQKRLQRIISWLAGIIKNGKLPIADRADAGRILGALGDPRRGVGKNEITGLPDIVWCHIPGGSFQMGNNKGLYDEEPVHQVTLDDFYMSRYPVTQAQFTMFVDAEGYNNVGYWPEAKDANVWHDGRVKGRWDENWREKPEFYGSIFSLGNHPVVGITWYEALAFCRWLDEQLREKNEIIVWHEGEITTTKIPSGFRVILPSEAEWEYAAHGGKNYEYLWGDEITPDHANYGDTDIGATSAAGCFPKGENDYGLLDMSGNVWEWSRSHKTDYPYVPKKGSEELGAGSGTRRILRGGSFNFIAALCRCGSRNFDFPNLRVRYYGFRLVLSPVPDSEL
ncbi:SUMF1/EgtB/PvdO family nonheme iron enzyme [candidate division KSB1 bacterium]|nr:SUMF1/EgtB/PvdO family nonheme iron enzyme [candidate division KSB1 bacterium]